MISMLKQPAPLPAVAFHKGPSFPGRQPRHLLMQSQQILLKETALFIAVEGDHRDHRRTEGGKNRTQRNTFRQRSVRDTFPENKIRHIHCNAKRKQQQKHFQKPEQNRKPDDHLRFSAVDLEKFPFSHTVVVFHAAAPSSACKFTVLTLFVLRSPSPSTFLSGRRHT